MAAQKEPVRAEALASYAAVVERYRGGDIDGAIKELTSHDRLWFTAALAALLAPANAVEQEAARRWSEVDIRAAALLHAEAVVGGWVMLDELDLHLAIARQLLDVSRSRYGPVDFERRWQLVVAWHLQRQLEIAPLAFHLEQAVRRFPNDGEVQLALGSFYEVAAWSRVPLVPLDTLPSYAVLRPLRNRSQRQIREQAAESFHRALAASAGLEEAHLRLGRVLTELDRFDEALQNLAPLRSGTEETRFRYLASLFAAAAEHRAGRLAAAERAYREAAQLYPACQTPWRGLTTVLRARGDRDQALDMTRRFTAMGTGCADPWWSYKFGQAAWRLDPVLAALRLEIAG